MRPPFVIRAMRLADHGPAHRLWRRTKGMSLGPDDSRVGIKRYLARNRGLCFVATMDTKVIGTVLCGHDGRRGILRHLAVAPKFRRQGIGRELVRRCLAGLAKQGVRKCNVFVMDYNKAGLKWWQNRGGVVQKYAWRTLQMPTGTGL